MRGPAGTTIEQAKLTVRSETKKDQNMDAGWLGNFNPLSNFCFAR